MEGFLQKAFTLGKKIPLKLEFLTRRNTGEKRRKITLCMKVAKNSQNLLQTQSAPSTPTTTILSTAQGTGCTA